ncbi:hypothetical protein, partial [Nocardia asiatica]|uniref:hypothetical protein n=1 Tax=Nocardia asiatica TaxID=209252 RepID=UPI0005C1ECB3
MVGAEYDEWLPPEVWARQLVKVFEDLGRRSAMDGALPREGQRYEIRAQDVFGDAAAVCRQRFAWIGVPADD